MNTERPRRVVGLTYKPIFGAGGAITHVERLTRWYGGSETMDTISTDDYQAVCDSADIAYYCDALDRAKARDATAYTCTSDQYTASHVYAHGDMCCGDAGDCMALCGTTKGENR